MKSTILTASYLLKDTLNRWWEQPSSPLARYTVSFLLSLVGVGLLVYMSFIEFSLESQVEKMGLNRMSMSQTLRASDYSGGIPEPDPNTYNQLSDYGDVLSVKFAFGRASSNYGPQFSIATYGDDALPGLAGFEVFHSSDGLIFFSSSIPAGSPITLTLDGTKLGGIVSSMPSLFEIGSGDNLLLLPDRFLQGVANAGYVHTVFFNRTTEEKGIIEIVDELEAFHKLDYPLGSVPAAPTITSASKLAKELHAFREKQFLVTAVMVAIVGGVIALVFGATAILELRQSHYVCALLNSFGVGNRAIITQRLTEGLVIANIGLATILLAIPVIRLFTEGSIAEVLSTFTLSANLPILLCVNLGAVIAILPLIAGLRKPIGEVLS